MKLEDLRCVDENIDILEKMLNQKWNILNG